MYSVLLFFEFILETKLTAMNKNCIFSTFFFSFLATCMGAIAQNDSLILNNGNVIVGEIKSMDKGVLQIETDYSDSDFKIELEGIKEIYSAARFLFTTSDGSRYTGTFKGL